MNKIEDKIFYLSCIFFTFSFILFFSYIILLTFFLEIPVEDVILLNGLDLIISSSIFFFVLGIFLLCIHILVFLFKNLMEKKQ